MEVCGGVRPDPQKITDLRSMPPPESKKELQSFLGFLNYQPPFIPNFAEKAAMLRDMTRDHVPFMWDENHQRCFETLKDSVTVESELQYFDTQITPVWEVDASIKGLGAAMIQCNKPVAFASKSLTDAEKRYACIERKLLAIVFGIQRFHVYLFGRYFRVITDHKPLVMILQKPISKASPSLQCMMLKRRGYQFDIEYRPGSEMIFADTFSRLPSAQNNNPVELDVRVDFVRFFTEHVDRTREAS